MHSIYILWNVLKLYALCRDRIIGYQYLRIKGPVKIQVSQNKGVLIVKGRFDLVGGRTNPLSKGSISHLRIDKAAKLEIGKRVRMSSVSIWVKNKIIIGDFVTIGANTTIIDSDMHELNYLRRREESISYEPISKAVIIGDDVFIGMNCIILKGVKIGRAAIIGANSVVDKDVPEEGLWKGNQLIV